MLELNLGNVMLLIAVLMSSFAVVALYAFIGISLYVYTNNDIFPLPTAAGVGLLWTFLTIMLSLVLFMLGNIYDIGLLQFFAKLETILVVLFSGLLVTILLMLLSMVFYDVRRYIV